MEFPEARIALLQTSKLFTYKLPEGASDEKGHPLYNRGEGRVELTLHVIFEFKY